MQSRPSRSGHVVVSGQPFDETLAFFVDTLGFRLDLITPADDPALAEVSGFGVQLRIDRSVEPVPLTLCLTTGEREPVRGPNGVSVTFADAVRDDAEVPELAPELVISFSGNEESWVVGRAGMRYRDLIPSRLGGRYIASHIEVCDGGPVPDLVHHHAIRFQMIFCHRGWVDVVYEDQGPPFRLEAGDCVLQPPHIRHKVLASSAGAQVVEIGCPADHDTLFDYHVILPTAIIDPDRVFGGQRFVRHQAASMPWRPSVHSGFEEQHTGIESATNGLASVRNLRAVQHADINTTLTSHAKDFWFLFVVEGSVKFAVDGASSAAPLEVGDSVAIPAGLRWCLRDSSPDLVLLEVVVD